MNPSASAYALAVEEVILISGTQTLAKLRP